MDKPWDKAIVGSFSDSMEHLTSFVENAPHAVISMDGSGRVLLWNRAAETMFGHSREEAVGRILFKELIVPSAKAGPWFRELENGRSPKKSPFIGKVIDTELRRKGGEVFPVELFFTVHEVSAGAITMFIIRDITRRRRAEEALRQSEELYRSFVQSFQGVAYRATMDWVPVLFHGAVEAITGYTEADFTAGRPRWDQVIHPEDWPGIRDSAERIRLVPGTSVEREYRIVRKDGEIRWVLELARNDCDDSGKPAWVQGCVYDITARKRSEERLAESEELYRTLVKTFPDAVTITDLTGIITFASERTLSLHGFTGPEEVLGKSAFDLFAPEDREKALEALQITLKKGLVTTYEYTLLRKDGTRFLVELNASLIHDASGQPKAFVATTRDITERRRMEEERRKMETAKIASETIEAMADGLILFSLDGTILAVNPAYEKISGRTRAELVGKKLTDVVPQNVKTPEDREKVMAVYEAFRKGNTAPPISVSLSTAGGRSTPIDYNASFIRDREGRPTAVVVTAKDMTELKKAEEERVKMEAAAKGLRLAMDTFEAMPEPLFLLDMTGRFVTVNPAFENMFACEKSELVGKNVSEFIPRWFRDDESRRALARLSSILQGIKPPTGFLTMIAKDGKEVPLAFSVSFVNNEEGKPTTIVVTASDLTEIRRAEQEIKASLKEKEVMLREIHHRVKNNIQTIVSLIQLHSQQFKDESHIAIFRDILNRIKSMSLVHERLYQAKELAQIDFRSYIRSLLEVLLVSHGARPEKIALKIEVDDVSLDVGTAIPLGLVLNELVSNALKHAFPHGRDGEIRIGLTAGAAGDLELVVRDNGVGLPENLDFRKAESLGLHLVTILVEDQLGGEILLDRSGGTQYTIRCRREG